MTNQRIAATFDQVATLLDRQRASPHRVRAWREAADAIRDSYREVGDVFRDHGRVGLEALPHIGPRLANVLIELVKTGHCTVLDRLRGEPVRALERIPGLGPCLAQRVHRELGIETLEELEVAAHDGRLATIPGFGPRRIEGLRDVLATRLQRRPRVDPADLPPLAVMLEIDREYRGAAAANRLPKIAPRRLNPTRDAWLPIMHADHGAWSFTAMFSNTALAHRLGRTDDWVVLYFHHAGAPDERSTVVTEWRGSLKGRRVVRGRERECEIYYAETVRERLAS